MTQSIQRKSGTPVWVWVIVGVGGGMVVLVIVGIIAAIAIPNFIMTRERANTRKTISDMRAIMQAVETYRLDNSNYPEASTIEQLNDVLQEEPRYISSPITTDAWGHPLIFERQPDGGYCILSTGSDGRRDAFAPYTDLPAETSWRGADIVMMNGEIVSCPAGALPDRR
jgi:general secretion pathway protein G